MINAGAISDLHGALPKIGQCDVLFICGDLFPLEYQNYDELCEQWFLDEFAKWVDKLPCKKVYLIAGNHDFFFDSMTKDAIEALIEYSPELKDKLVYVCDELITIEGGLTLYGTPWCTGPRGWAFIDVFGTHYNDIPDCDILLTHQPPTVNKLGCSYPDTPWERNWGSDDLKKVISERNIRYNFCGHIHTGTHGGTGLPGKDTVFYNVSIKDEDYIPSFPVTYVEIETKDKNNE